MVIAPSKPDPEKLSAYECGFNAFGDARMKFDVRFYLVSILFIIFDLEVAFLFPWAITLKADRRLRLLVDDGVPRRADRRLHLRMEEGGARMGVSPDKCRPAWPHAPASKAAPRRSTTTIPISRRCRPRWPDKGFLVASRRCADQLGAHRLADVDDLRARLLRGRDDAGLDAALRSGALRLRAARLPAPVRRDDRRRHA